MGGAPCTDRERSPWNFLSFGRASSLWCRDATLIPRRVARGGVCGCNPPLMRGNRHGLRAFVQGRDVGANMLRRPIGSQVGPGLAGRRVDFMRDTISIYGREVRPPLSPFFLRPSTLLQHRRPTAVVVDSNAPFVPRFLEQAVDASARNEVYSRVQGRHISLQNQSRARARGRTKKNKREQGMKAPRLRPESWRLPDNETR